nr:WbuC family cupin fold metalloprotein [uncultured Pseudodesulfovibrio sp.]
MTENSTDYPLAMDTPETDVTPLSLTMVGALLAQSREAPRKRMLQTLHTSHDALAHRMFNAMQPGTYIMPHRHLDPPKDETILVMAGSLIFVQFTDEGVVENTILLQPGTENFGIDVAPHIYHTFIPLKQDTLVFETKTGPYEPDSDKNVPDWAPREGSPEAEPYLLELIKSLAEKANAAVDQMNAEKATTE